MSSTAADSYETLLTENMAAAFASDSTFYSSYGPANALLGNFAIAYNSVNAPPPPPESTSPPPPVCSDPGIQLIERELLSSYPRYAMQKCLKIA